MESIQDYIFKLKINVLPKNRLLCKIFEILPNITNLIIQYDKKQGRRSTPSFKKDVSIVSPRKIRGTQGCETSFLSEALQTTTYLCSLTLSNSQIDDDKIRILVAGLNKNSGRNDLVLRNTLVYLDVSHNKITTDGLRLLAIYFLEEDCRNDHEGDTELGKVCHKREPLLVNLNAADNCIHAEGGRTIGRLLRNNKSLVNLDLRLNRLGDSGCQFVIEGLKQNDTLKILNLASNGLASLSITTLSTLLKGFSEDLKINSKGDRAENYSSNGLESIDLSSNDLSDDDLIILVSAVQHTHHLVALDLRQNRCDGKASKNIEDALKSIKTKLYHNAELTG